MTKKQEPGHLRKIDAAFKHEVVRLVLDKDMPVREVAIAMGVGDTAVRRWVQQYKSANGLPRPSGPLTAEQLRIRELEIENRQLREDNDILKKASAFFARTLR